MGRLIDQLCTACDTSFYLSPFGQSILLFILTLVGGSHVIDPYIRLDPYLATRAHVRMTLERVVRGSKMSESFLVIGLIRAIEDVLEDCSQELRARTGERSLATERLVRHGILSDIDGRLRVAGDTGALALDPADHARADLEMWQKQTEAILEEQNLEQSICAEVEDE